MNERDITIDRLLLRGQTVSAARADRIREAIAVHLRELIRANGLPPGAGPHLELPSIRLPYTVLGAGGSDEQVARRIARAVYRSLFKRAAQRR